MNCGTLIFGFRKRIFDFLYLRRRAKRPHMRVRLQRVANHDTRRLLTHARDQILQDRTMDQRPRSRHTALS